MHNLIMVGAPVFIAAVAGFLAGFRQGRNKSGA